MPVFFFFLGLGISYLYHSPRVMVQAEGKPYSPPTADQLASASFELEEEVAQENPYSPQSDVSTAVSSKFTIKEIQPISADRHQAQTGQLINFQTRLKNIGPEKKHLTHVCFNHSGGVTFGCLNGPQGPNLSPGEELSIHNSMIFTQPGNYSVWLTWSQDGVNFYRALEAGRVEVRIE